MVAAFSELGAWRLILLLLELEVDIPRGCRGLGLWHGLTCYETVVLLRDGLTTLLWGGFTTVPLLRPKVSKDRVPIDQCESSGDEPLLAGLLQAGGRPARNVGRPPTSAAKLRQRWALCY